MARRCGKRLNCWKTMPMRCRTAGTLTPLPVISSPSKKIRPLSTGSSRLTQRSSVLLPLPLGPMITSASPALTVRSMPSSTTLSPKLLWTSSSRTTGVVAAREGSATAAPELCPTTQLEIYAKAACRIGTQQPASAFGLGCAA